MAVIWQASDPPLYDQEAGDCFYCGEPINFPAVGWLGASGFLVVHTGCVLPLFERLVVDKYAAHLAEALP